MYDLLIKDGTVVDGSGGAGYRADVAVQDGKIAAIGRLNGKARQTIDAEGHVVRPGILGSLRLLLVLPRRYQRGYG